MKNKIIFFCGKISFLSFGFHLLFTKVGHNAWISIILGTFLGAFIIYLFNLLKEYKKDINIKNYKLLNIIYKIIFILIYSFIIVLTLSLLPLFINTFYLVNTPKIITIVPFFLTAMYVASKGENILFKLSNLLFVFSLALILLTFITTFKYLDFTVLLPILDVSKINLLESIFIYAALSSIPSIITINYNNNFKDELKLYLFTSLIILSICLITVLMLDRELIKMYSFPAYTVLKRISILEFIENIENFLSFVWYFDYMITLACGLLNLKNTINNKNIYYVISFVLVLFTVYFLSNNYQYLNLFVYNTYYILYIILFLIIILIIILKHKKNKQKV